jgi:uncharacterized GH25 family protein
VMAFVLRVALALSVAATAHAHVLWINVVPQAEEHVIVSLAYGDFLPGSELMTTDWGLMSVQSYELIAPDGARSSLGPPALVAQPKKLLPANVSVQAAGDTGVRKLALSAQTKQGTYQVAAQTPVYEYTKYRDRAGAEHYTDAPVATLKDVATILNRSFEVMFMKAAFTVGDWSEPAPVGQLLEIVPLSNLAAVKVGDVVRFKVLFDGRAWNPVGVSPQITAQNMSLGDRWGIYSPLIVGAGELRVSHAGLWKINARFQAAVGSDERYQILAPKAPADARIFFESTFVMNVAP